MHLWLNLISWSIDIQENFKLEKYVQSQWRDIPCGISILAENREGDIGIQTKLQNYNSEMDYLKLLLLDF